MAKENLELILHDEYEVLKNLQAISDTIPENLSNVSLGRIADNQRGLTMILSDMQKYIVILAEELKQKN